MSGDKQEWWRGAVIYQIYPRSFFDSNNDGIGDLPGITAKLDYVADLGVDAVWISPFFQSPMKDFGYDISDYRAIDPIFGDMEDFDDLIAKAHSLNLKVMLDLVLSHSSDQHPWFKESRKNKSNPKAGWYVWADARQDGSAPNNWLSVFGGSAWQWDENRQQFYLHNFLASQPDFNFHNPQVRQQMLDETEYWLKRNVDGVRLDVVNYYFHHPSLQDNPLKTAAQMESFMGLTTNPYNKQEHLFDKSQPDNLIFLKTLRKLTEKYPGSILLGEIGDDEAALLMGQYTSNDDKLHMAYCFRLLRDIKGADFIRSAVEEHEQHIGNGWPCWAMSNHDASRAASRWASSGAADPKEAFILLALLLSLRGSVCIYQGEELGLPEADIQKTEVLDPFGLAFWPEYKGRDGCRTPIAWCAEKPHGGFSKTIPWLPVSEAHKTLAVEEQERDLNSVLNKFKSFIRWRRQHPAMLDGNIKFFDCEDDCLLFTRQDFQQEIVCAFNLSHRHKKMLIPAQLKMGILVDMSYFYHHLEGDSIILPPFQAAYWLL